MKLEDPLIANKRTMFMQNPTDKSLFREEAVEILLRALTSEESSEQILSASILSNLAGTYTWTGESYTAAWFLRKTGLNSPYHQNMIRNFNWLDQSLQVSFQIGLYIKKKNMHEKL